MLIKREKLFNVRQTYQCECGNCDKKELEFHWRCSPTKTAKRESAMSGDCMYIIKCNCCKQMHLYVPSIDKNTLLSLNDVPEGVDSWYIDPNEPEKIILNPKGKDKK